MKRVTQTEVLTIQSLESLFELYRETRRRTPPRYKTVNVVLPALSEEENMHWEQRLDRLYFACGCSIATVVGLLATATYLGWIIAAGNLTVLTAAMSVLVFLFAGAWGKVFGRMYARLQLQRAIIQLRDVVFANTNSDSQQWPPNQPAQSNLVCG